ncbi:hypothetical protein C8J57DRAFT_1517380 [Mycena rebaudengoi]|nr:hypothetical protein C8J57DRAFT_1517380 [Mycena rebaudengoi]
MLSKLIAFGLCALTLIAAAPSQQLIISCAIWESSPATPLGSAAHFGIILGVYRIVNQAAQGVLTAGLNGWNLTFGAKIRKYRYQCLDVGERTVGQCSGKVVAVDGDSAILGVHRDRIRAASRRSELGHDPSSAPALTGGGTQRAWCCIELAKETLVMPELRAQQGTSAHAGDVNMDADKSKE